jgi:hypothetical protein
MDTYWAFAPCPFVMNRVYKEKIFGTPALVRVWIEAVRKHPVAYAQHRLSHFIALLTTGGRTADFERLQVLNRSGPSLRPLIAVNDLLKWTILFRVGPWFLLVLVVCIIAWRKRTSPTGTYAVAVSLSAVLYVATPAALHNSRCRSVCRMSSIVGPMSSRGFIRIPNALLLPAWEPGTHSRQPIRQPNTFRSSPISDCPSPMTLSRLRRAMRCWSI